MTPHIVSLDDPLNPRGWVAEPARRRVASAFPGLEWRLRPVGMVETWEDYDGPEVDGGRAGVAAACARLAERHGMPIDEYLWFEDAPTSSWSACRAIAAALLQGDAIGARAFRACREATFIRRRSLSDPPQLREVLDGVPGLDGEAAAEAMEDGRADRAFEAHRAAARETEAPGVTRAGGRVELPTLIVRDGDRARGVSGIGRIGALEEAVAEVTGREPATGAPGVAALLERFSTEGWVSPVELAAATGREEAAVTARARALVEAGRATEERFAASPFFRIPPGVDPDDGA